MRIVEVPPDATEAAKGAPERDERRWRVTAGLAGLFVAAAVVMAFPSIGRWRVVTPGDYGDSFLYQYLLRWDVHALFGGHGSVFDAPFFWPHKDTLLYSDTVLAAAPLAGAVAALVGWTVAFNVLYLGTWVASLASTYALARWVRASRAGAVLAAFVFTFAAVRLGHYGHFQLLFAFLIPLTLWLLLRFLTERRWWQAVAIGLCCTSVFFNSGYIAVALIPALAVVAMGWLAASRFRPGRRFWTGLALAGAVAVATSWPVLSAYGSLGAFLKRPYLPEEAVTLRSFLAPAGGSLLYGRLERWAGMSFEKRLFPGFVALALAAAGLASLAASRRARRRKAHQRAGPRGRARLRMGRLRRSRRRGPRSGPRGTPDLRRRGLVLVALSGLPALVLAFGRSQVVFGRKVMLPYSWVDTLPGFQSIRAFGRFTVVVLLAAGLLAALGYDRLVRGRSRTTAIVVAVVLAAVMLMEYRAQIVTSERIDRPRFTAVNRALARLPDGVVLELPMARDEAWGFVEAPRMVLSTIDWKPRVGGYSGYTPPGYDRTVALMNSLDDGGPARPEALELIDRLGVRYLVLRLAPFDDRWEWPGASYTDEGGAETILRALPSERVEAVTREGAALLVRLKPAAVSRP